MDYDAAQQHRLATMLTQQTLGAPSEIRQTEAHVAAFSVENPAGSAEGGLAARAPRDTGPHCGSVWEHAFRQSSRYGNAGRWRREGVSVDGKG
jgi:hypothetical protein